MNGNNHIKNNHLPSFFHPERIFFNLYLGGGLQYKVWVRPGTWMNEERMNRLLKDIHEIALAGKGEKDIPDYGVLKGERKDLENRVITICYEKKTGRPVGLSAQVLMDVPLGLTVVSVLHLGLVYVAKDFQKKSIVGLLYLLPCMLLMFRTGFRPLWVSNVSQVPSIVGMVAEYFENTYPNPIQETKQTIMHKSLAEGIIKHYRSAFGTGEDAIFDTGKQIIYNSYTGGSDNLKKSFEECPKHRNEKVNAFCKENLDYTRGDDFLQVAVLSGKIINNFFAKRLHGTPRLEWYAYLMMIGIVTTALPALKWLTRKPK